MEIKYECLSCITRQLTKLAVKLTNDKNTQQDIIKYGLDVISNNYPNSSAPYITGLIYNYAKKITEIKDPYRDEKKKFNHIAEQLVSELSLNTQIENSESPVDTAIRLSIAGNIIDFGLGINVDELDVRDSINHSLTTELFGGTSEDFLKATHNASNILFIGDNAGEIVFDKLLIERLPLHKITYVVKGGPIVNDVTMEDATTVGMDKLVKIIDSGASIQGIELSACSDDFLKSFKDADMIISKGQANFESLSCLDNKTIFFLLRAKCQSVADEVGCAQNQFVLLHKE
ncbi:ARMT1-like domain-containing protein [Clostridiaceae bacterium M8S5]|nr:ARMT1-like domain-containing protein [Clostridiaceae bacterium M8S5]